MIKNSRYVPSKYLALMRSVLRGLNGDARIVETSHGRASLDAILHAGQFNEKEAQEHPLWFRELNGAHEHVPATEE